MRIKLLLGVLGLVSLTWSARGTPQAIQTQQTDERASARTERSAVETPQASSRPDEAKHSLDALLQAQLDALDLQKRQLVEAAQEQNRQTEEQAREQIDQWKSEVARQTEQLHRSAKRQIEQTQSYVKRQVELLEAQKKFLAAQAAVIKATRETAPKAGPGAVEEKLDKILDRLERLENRINKLEKGAPGGGF